MRRGWITPGRYRWRTTLRGEAPWWLINLGFAAKSKKDCGNHEWYRQSDTMAACYHCEVGQWPLAPDDQITDDNRIVIV